MKKVLTLLVVVLTAVSFASVAMADHHMKEEAKPAEAAAGKTEKVEKKDAKKIVKKDKKGAKKDEKKKKEIKPAAKGKKEVSGC